MNTARKLLQERRARLAAERLLEQKQAELHEANRRLGTHARDLSSRITQTEAQVQLIRDENTRVKSDLSMANQKVMIAERRLWQAIETIQDGFAFFDPAGRLIAANRAWIGVFDGIEAVRPGIAYIEILQLLTEEGIVNTGDLAPATWRERMMARWREPAPPPEIIRLWTGQYIKLIDQPGDSGDVVSLALDINGTIRYQKRLKEARRRAEAASRAKSAFLANMSHEIRTPMNGVIGMAELLQETALDADQQLYASTIRNSGEALLAIINDVLDYSKIGADKLSLHPAPFDLPQELQDLVTLLQPTARSKGIALRTEYDPALPAQLEGDAGRLRQVLTNLMGNAVKFTDTGHVRLCVSSTVSGSMAQLAFVVEDTGIGIDRDKLALIFDEFSQVEEAGNRKYEGTGLGLAIAQKLARMMGGEIWCQSAPGQGSRFGFSLTLPVVAPKPAPPRRMRVLAVEDNKTNRLVFRKMVKGLDIDLQFAENGQLALDVYARFAPDVIFMDISMPVMDGKTATRTLRDQGATLPIIAMTAHANAGSEADILQAGLTCYLTKPLKKADIIEQICNACPEDALHPGKPGGAQPACRRNTGMPSSDISGQCS